MDMDTDLFVPFSTKQGQQADPTPDPFTLPLTCEPLDNSSASDYLASSPEFCASSPASVLTTEEPELIQPAFNVSALTVDELRDECRRRQLDAGGCKALLVERITTSINHGETKPRRISSPSKKRKRPHTRKEPERHEYSSQAQFDAAWKRWRNVRNSNNESVKKSRERERAKRREKEELCKKLEAENEDLERLAEQARDTMAFLSDAVSNPFALAEADFTRLQAILRSSTTAVS